MLCYNCNPKITEMLPKNGKFGQYWQCPVCGKTKKRYNREVITDNTSQIDNRIQLLDDNLLSDQQLNFIRLTEFDYNTNYILVSTAGSGKTFVVGQKILRYNDPSLKIIYLVFNSQNAKEASEKLPEYCITKTLHSFCMGQFLRFYHKKYKRELVKLNKVESIIKNLMVEIPPEDEKTEKEVFENMSTITKTVALLKNLYLDPSIDNIEFVINEYGLLTDTENLDLDTLYQLIIIGFNESLSIKDYFDFDDLLYWVGTGEIICEKFDKILLDECQDINKIQRMVIKAIMKENSQLMFVGDENQAIYAFRGADSESIQNIKKEFDCKELPLSVSRRCSKSVGNFINNEFPYIDFSVLPEAKEGKIEHIKESEMFNYVLDGDLVLCRMNAPLVKPCFALLKQGKKAIIKGRDIGKDLTSFIWAIQKKYNAETLTELLNALSENFEKESIKLMAQKKDFAVEILSDKTDTIFALSDNSDTITDLILNIEKIFEDEKTTGITFSSVHKAKGLESQQVFILRNDLMPSKKAITEKQLRQEQNIRFVAYTRAKENLFFLIPD